MAPSKLSRKAPDKRATIILFKEETGRGDQIRTYDGRAGWVRTPLNVVGEFQLNGSDLDGARFDAQLSFPGQIKQILTNLKTGPPTTITDLAGAIQPVSLQQDVDVGTDSRGRCRPGNRAEGLLVTLYFDQQTGLLLRELRYGSSPIGRSSHANRLRRLSRRQRNQVAVPHHVRVAGRTRFDRAERDTDECSD